MPDHVAWRATLGIHGGRSTRGVDEVSREAEVGDLQHEVMRQKQILGLQIL